jgi:hypothetical protein
MPIFMLENPNNRSAGTSLENVAEEVLNGIFCHYEPPTSESAQVKAAKNFRAHPTDYGFEKQKQRKRSILRTSRLFRKTKKARQKQEIRSVTWRDEKSRSHLEGRVEACAAEQCDFFGKSTKGGDGLADSLSPKKAAKVHEDNIIKEQKEQQRVKMTEPLKEDGTPKKVMYDDEGNPIYEDGSDYQDENDPPSPSSLPSPEASENPADFECSSYPRMSNPFLNCDLLGSSGRSVAPGPVPAPVPPAPTGHSELRKTAMEDSNVYEPENYNDRPAGSAQSHAYRRMRSPPIRKPTPRHTYDNEEDLHIETENRDRLVKMPRSRSQSPSRHRTENNDDRPHYGDQYDSAEEDPYGEDASPRSPRRKGGWMKSFRRPGTPGRRGRNGKESDDDAEYASDGSLVDRLGRVFRRRSSSSRERGRPARGHDDEENYYEDGRGRTRSRSPGHRSDMVSDITEDVYQMVPPSRGRSHSPGYRSQQGIEIDYTDGRARPRSRSPGRRDYHVGDDYETPLTRQPTRDYDMDRRRSRENGDSADIESRPIRDYDEYRRRSRDYENGLDRRPTRDHGEDIDRRRSKEHDASRRSSKSQDDGKLEQDEGANRVAPRSRKSKSANEKASIESDDKRKRYSKGDLSSQETGGDSRKSSRPRRVSDPVPPPSRKYADIDESDDDEYDRRRPPSTTSSSQRSPTPLETAYESEDGVAAAAPNRDPTPRLSMEPEVFRDKPVSRHNPLPPTPRRKDRSERSSREDRDKPDKDEPRRSRSSKDEDDAHRSRSSRDEDETRRPRPLDVKQTEEPSMHRALKTQLSPTSMATDDEIREEASSVGMESNTLRPVRYPNPFMHVPPPILEDQEMTNTDTEQDPSTLSYPPPSKATLSTGRSSRDSAEERKSRKKHEKSRKSDVIQASSSGSSRSKKLWRGWKKTIGKVKSIVHDIDEKRIPPPVMPGVGHHSKPSRKVSSKE